MFSRANWRCMAGYAGRLIPQNALLLSQDSQCIIASRVMLTCRFHSRGLTFRRFYPQTGKSLLAAAAGVVLLSWFVFSILISSWGLVDSSNSSHRLWYAGSVLILAASAGYVSREILRRSGLLSSYRGGSSPASPLTGAPCPVPICPTPHLVRSAAKRLPLQRRPPIDATSRHTQ